ncbi:ArnT family glycosyltransferase [Novispirillum sp. DQ9]|uniref:ArnT family glycosyltransferase n=1 Tax=Novispirillum sp. DQ9 TaxID=3398612 RepID=UPI003C7BE2D7
MQSLVQGFRPYLLLTLLVLVAVLPGLDALPVMDRDEARFVQATRQMTETGDYVVVRFLDELRAKKPVGIYWLQAAAVEIFSHPADTRAWPYRLPSLLGVLAAVLMTFRLGAALFDRRIALVAAGILGTALIAVVEAHLAKTDAMLLGLTTVVMACLGVVYMSGKGGPRAPSWVPLVFWLALGCAILIKGPVTPMIVLLAGIALAVADRSWGWLNALRPVMGVILTAAVVAPWVMAVSAQTEGAFLGQAVRDDLLPKLIGGQESHGAPPGYHTLLASLLLWPASLFLWPALARAWRERSLPGLRFALAWLIPAWVVFELVPTKLPHYTLPLYPALALIIATTLFAVRDGTYERLAGLPARVWYALWVALGVALAGGMIAAPVLYGDGLSVWAVVAALGVLGAVAGGLWHALRRRYLNALAAGMAGAVVLYIAVFAGVMPSLSALWVSQRVAAAADAAAPGAALAAVGFHEPSLVFLMGSDTLLADDGAAAVAALADKRVGAAAVEARAGAGFLAAAESRGLRVRATASVEGLNYSRGKPVLMTLYVVE